MSTTNPSPEKKELLAKKRLVTDYSEVMRTFARGTSRVGSFLIRPKAVRIGIQQENEKVLMLLRRHPVTNLPWMSVVFVMLVAPIGLGMLPFLDVFPDRFGVAARLLWWLLTLGIAVEGFLSWYYNVYIITDERIIDVDFLNLIYKNVSAAKIDNIEDVTVEMSGAIRSMLNYGTIQIQTAAEKTEFEFEDVPNPQVVAKFINEMMLEEEQEKLEGRVS